MFYLAELRHRAKAHTTRTSIEENDLILKDTLTNIPAMEDEAERNMDFANKIQMTVPERITLSAGYDGDDNQDHVIVNPMTSSFAGDMSTFDETPLVNPDFVMAGMPTPPSVLTIDHSLGNNIVSNSPNWHSEGDGAVADENETSLQKYTRLRGGNVDTSAASYAATNGDAVHGSRSTDAVGCVAGGESNVPLDDPRAMQAMFTNMQRRLNLLEGQLQYQSRVSNVWNFLLITLVFANPFVYRYFFGRGFR